MKWKHILLVYILIFIAFAGLWHELSYRLTIKKGELLIPLGSNAVSAFCSELPFKRCISIGNALEAPKGISWNVQMDKRYFDLIKAAGFDSVRIPVRFSDYAKENPGYQIEEEFMSEVDGYVDYALELGLTVILDLHHFEELMEYPLEYSRCFLAIWEQLSLRYKDYPPELIFELLNEPQKNLKDDVWNKLLAEAVFVVRKENPDRFLIIGPDNYNSLHRLQNLKLPDDKKIIISIHYYAPNDFAFQGDPYHESYKELSNIPWGKPDEIKRLKDDFQKAASWAKANDRQVFLGEFGVNRSAPAQYRELWIKMVREHAEEVDFAWGFWEFCSNFGIYDSNTDKWDEKLMEALID